MRSFYKRYSFLIVLLVSCVITLFIYSWFVDTTYFQSLLHWAQEHIVWFCIILLTIKVIAIIWPPLPGIVFSIAAIPIIGWELALAVNLVGETTGASAAFWLSRTFGPKVVLRLFGQGGLDQVHRFKFNPKNEFEAIFVMRAFTGAISELVSYGAGLTPIRYRNYFFTSLLSNFVVGLPLFYLIGLVLGAENILFGIIPLVLGVILLYLLRNRYFVWK